MVSLGFVVAGARHGSKSAIWKVPLPDDRPDRP